MWWWAEGGRMKVSQYLQFAPFLGYVSVEWEDENDRGDSCQSRWPDVL